MADGPLAAAILALGVRVVLDQLSVAGVWPEDLASVLDELANADDAALDRWAGDLGSIGEG